MMMLSKFAQALALAAIVVQTSIALAQPNVGEPLEQEGTVMGVMPNTIQMLSDKGGPWLILVDPRQTIVKVTGTAEPDFLRPGIYVKFTGEIDKKGTCTSEIKELEIATPSGKTAIGVFPAGSDDKAKPVSKLEDGSYDIRGKVTSYRDGELVVMAGKKITGKLAADAKLNVNAGDISFAQKDDAVKVVGLERSKPNAERQIPGQGMAKEITITLSKPLAGMAKKGPKPPKSKGKPPIDGETPAAGGDSANPDPFGLEKAANKK